MGLFSLFSHRLGRYFYARRAEDSMRRFVPPALSPKRLEKRRVLDAGAAELIFGTLADTSEFVQVGENSVTSGDSEGSNYQGPSNVMLYLGGDEVSVNQELQLAVMFEGNVEVSHTLTVDWGDGSPIEIHELEPGSHFLGTCHQYLTDSPTNVGSETNVITVRISDPPGNQAEANADVAVTGVAPAIESLSINSPIVEGQTATLTGTFVDPETQETYLLDIDWDGDNIFDETIEVSGGEFEASRLFPDDNPTGTLSDTFDVTVRLRGEDFVTETRSVPLTIIDESPFNVIIEPIGEIDENGFAEVRITFEDPGDEDTHFATINWGDGSPLERVDIEPGARSFVARHQYLDDDPTGTSQDSYTIRVGVINDDLGRSVPRPTAEVIVNNVKPVLMVAADQEVDEGALLDLTGGGLGAFTDVGTRDTHTAVVDWGDGSAPEVVSVNQANGSGTLDGSHIYADNGVYTVTVTLLDDDLGQTTGQFEVTVNNVDPFLLPPDELPQVDEGATFNLADLEILLKDPGFDNPLNPNSEGEGSVETFTAATINWGDGTAVESLGIVNVMSGGPGVATMAEFDNLQHTFADNGLYTVTITVGDDDGGLVERTFQIQVNNVAPTLELTSRELVLRESETLDLFDLGTFSDPGFNNPLNILDPSNGGEVEETFTYTIDWGDGTLETGQLPASVLNGAIGKRTLGTLVDQHQYLDNDDDNLYTIKVTLSDDDGGTVTREITAKVLNVDPTLIPIISATDVSTRGETTIVIEFEDPGTEELIVWVDWGDKLSLPPQDRFVPEIAVPGPGTNTVTLQHRYSGPPDPTSPASDIVISVFVRDDDFGMPLVLSPGQSETQSVAISNPGVGGDPIVIDTTPEVPRLLFPSREETVALFGANASDVGTTQTTDLRTAVGDTKSTTDRYLELRVVDPATGEESEGFRLKDEVLDDLPGLFRTLPDNRYAIYLVRTETNTRRLVIEVFVRNGKVIDPGDDSEGTRERPPTDDSEQAAVQEVTVEDEPILKPARPEIDEAEPADKDPEVADPAASNSEDALPTGEIRRRMLLGTSVVGLAASQAGLSWSDQIEKALGAANAKKWSKLRRRLNKRNNSDKRKNK